jgi:hypothetical protein
MFGDVADCLIRGVEVDDVVDAGFVELLPAVVAADDVAMDAVDAHGWSSTSLSSADR